MSRLQAWDVNGTPVEDTVDFPQEVRAADQNPNGGLYALLWGEGETSLALADGTGISVLATVGDARGGSRINNRNATVQGIGTDGVATIDSGNSDGDMVLRFWRNPAVLRVGPAVKRARFAG